MKIPEGWKETKIGRIARVVTGGTPSRKKPAYWGGDIPWVSTSLIKFNVISKTDEYITLEGVKNSSAKIYPAGTVLMAMFGQGVTRGKVAILGIDATFNQACVAIIPNEGNSTFLYYLLESSYEKLRYLSNSGSQDNLNATLIKGFDILLPPLAEQMEIARILGAWDDALSQLSALIAAKTQRKRALMQQLLSGARRFPEFAGQDWKTHQLGELFWERNECNRPDLPLLSITSDRGVILRDEVERKDTSNENKSAYLRIARGDIGYNTMRMWQGVSALSRLEGLISPAYTVCVPNELINAEYAAYLFKSAPMISIFHRHSQGMVSDTLNLKFHHFARISVSIPPSIEEQKRIAQVLGAATREIETLQAQRQVLAQQKRGLMQKLLSGETRVKL